MLENLIKKDFDFDYANITYYELDKKINDNIFRKYFIVDIRNMTDDKINSIFDNFDLFNELLLEDKYFLDVSYLPFNYTKNMMLLFLYDDSKKSVINNHDVLYNMKYAYKKFVTEDELSNIILNSSINLDYSNIVCTSSDGKRLLPGFNLLYGLNGSGKSKLLFDFYSKFNFLIPMYNMYNDDLNLIDMVKDKSLIDSYFRRLNESDKYDINSNIGDYLHRLSQILALSEENSSIVFIDDLCWGSLDDRNQINVLDTLFDYSCINPVSITSCQSNIKRLVKNRVYSPNIIDL